jgi:hypothetical protein
MSQKTVNVVAALQIDKYCLRLQFDDQTVQYIDFWPFLERSIHPDIRTYLDPERFAKFKVQHGELVWGDYDLCFPVMDLYRNTIEHKILAEIA